MRELIIFAVLASVFGSEGEPSSEDNCGGLITQLGAFVAAVDKDPSEPEMKWSDPTEIPSNCESRAQEIVNLAIKPYDPAARKVALNKTLQYLGLSEVSEYCGISEEHHSGNLKFLYLFTQARNLCNEKAQSRIRGFTTNQACAHNFAHFFGYILQKQHETKHGSADEWIKMLAPSSEIIAAAKGELSAQGNIPISKWIADCPSPLNSISNRNHFFYMEDSDRKRIISNLKQVGNEQDTQLRAQIAAKILRSMPWLYKSWNGLSYLDAIKILNGYDKYYTYSVCEIAPDQASEDHIQFKLMRTESAGEKTINTFHFLLRQLEGFILCGYGTLKELKDGEPKADADSLPTRTNDEAAVKEVAERMAGFTKNVHDYSNELTLVGIRAAEAATRVQVHASLAELVLVVLSHRERIREMQAGVAGQITTVVKEIGDLLQIQPPTK